MAKIFKHKYGGKAFLFESADEMRGYLVEHNKPLADYANGHPDGAWAGGSVRQAFNGMTHGDRSLVSKSEVIMRGFDDMMGEVERTISVPAIAGGAPNVPAMLAGSPMSMRRRQPVRVQAPSVTFVASHWHRVDVPKEHILRRGVTVLAVVRALSAVMPITLWSAVGLGSGGTNTVVGFKVETDPIDLVRAAWAVSSPQVLRTGFHGVTGIVHGKATKGGYKVSEIEKNPAEAWSNILGSEAENTIVLEGISGKNSIWSSDKTAAKWSSDMIARFQK
jgi:hypothetical protein